MIHSTALEKAMRDIAKKKGDFWFFAMVMRTETPGRWELVASAPWLEAGKLTAVGELARLLSRSIGEEPLYEFARIATLPHDSEFLQFVVNTVGSVDHEMRVRSTDFRARGIEEAIIFYAQKPTRHSAAGVSH